MSACTCEFLHSVLGIPPCLAAGLEGSRQAEERPPERTQTERALIMSTRMRALALSAILGTVASFTAASSSEAGLFSPAKLQMTETAALAEPIRCRTGRRIHDCGLSENDLRERARMRRAETLKHRQGRRIIHSGEGDLRERAHMRREETLKHRQGRRIIHSHRGTFAHAPGIVPGPAVRGPAVRGFAGVRR